jgi:hypothetical protein
VGNDATGGTRLQIDAEAFERLQRLAMYEIVCAMLDLTCEVQETLGLRPDACQVYLLIAVSAVQRYARAPDGAYVGIDPIPLSESGTISRRRIADASGLPRETVARHVRNLIGRGLVIEVGRGRLTTPPGLLRDVGPTGLLDRMARHSAGLANALLRLEVLVPVERPG